MVVVSALTLLGPTRRLEGWVLICCLSVLARYVDTGTQSVGTKIGAVFQKSLIPTI